MDAGLASDEGIHGSGQNGTDIWALNMSNISTAGDTAGGSFFDTYFSLPRFGIETAMALIAAILNAIILIAVRSAHSSRSRSVYNTLFVNLAVADILSCLLSWMCNNIFFLFSSHLSHFYRAGDICSLFLYLVAAVFVSNGFGIVSTLTMLGFTTVQYFAICRPLQHQSILRPKKVCLFIACSWLVSILGGMLPFFILLIMGRGRKCDYFLLRTVMDVVVHGCNAYLAILGVIYVAIVALCFRIYLEIRRVHRQMARLRYDQDFQGEKKAFITIIILLTTLTLFFVPFSVMYAVSFNSEEGMSGMGSSALIYYMTLLPYLKFLSDPIIYGLRMREVRDGCLRLALKCGLDRCACFKSGLTLLHRNPQSSMTMHNMNSFRATSETFYGRE